MSFPRTLVTGGSGSGKSRYAEGLLALEARVTYVAPGAVPDPTVDPEWAARVAEHQQRRPSHWTTVETGAVASALRAVQQPVIVDCLGTWLTRYLDDTQAWDRPYASWQPEFEAAVADLVQAWRTVAGPAVAVTNEVGWGLVSEHRSGRLFTRLLGQVNVAMAQASDRVTLVVAGRPLHL